MGNAKKYMGWVQIQKPLIRAHRSKKAKKRDGKMHVYTHQSRFALVSRVSRGDTQKKYTG